MNAETLITVNIPKSNAPDTFITWAEFCAANAALGGTELARIAAELDSDEHMAVAGGGASPLVYLFI